MWRIVSNLLPGWVVDPGPGYFATVGCPVDPGHLREERTYANVPFEEPPRLQRRLLDRADAVKVQGTAALLLRVSVIEAMRRAGLTGWSCVPAVIRLRDGALRDDMAELRPLVPGAFATAAEGYRPAWVCRGCGLRRLEKGLRPNLAAGRLDPGRGDVQIIWPALETLWVSDRARRVLEAFETDELTFRAASDDAPPSLRRNESAPPPDWPDQVRAGIDALWRDVPKGPPSSMA